MPRGQSPPPESFVHVTRTSPHRGSHLTPWAETPIATTEGRSALTVGCPTLSAARSGVPVLGVRRLFAFRFISTLVRRSLRKEGASEGPIGLP